MARVRHDMLERRQLGSFGTAYDGSWIWLRPRLSTTPSRSDVRGCSCRAVEGTLRLLPWCWEFGPRGLLGNCRFGKPAGRGQGLSKLGPIMSSIFKVWTS